MPALFFVYEKDRKEERKRIACQPTRKVLFKVLTILDSKRENALGRMGERKRKRKSGVASSKRYEKEKEGVRTHCAWATSFLRRH